MRVRKEVFALIFLIPTGIVVAFVAGKSLTNSSHWLDAFIWIILCAGMLTDDALGFFALGRDMGEGRPNRNMERVPVGIPLSIIACLVDLSDVSRDIFVFSDNKSVPFHSLERASLSLPGRKNLEWIANPLAGHFILERRDNRFRVHMITATEEPAQPHQKEPKNINPHSEIII